MWCLLGLFFAVNIAAMTHPNDLNHQSIFVDLIDNPIIANPYSVSKIATLYLGASMWSRITSKIIHCRHYLTNLDHSDTTKILLGRLAPLNQKGFHLYAIRL